MTLDIRPQYSTCPIVFCGEGKNIQRSRANENLYRITVRDKDGRRLRALAKWKEDHDQSQG